jgi:hypothetical protein
MWARSLKTERNKYDGDTLQNAEDRRSQIGSAGIGFGIKGLKKGLKAV